MSSLDSALIKVVESNTFWELVHGNDGDHKSDAVRRRAYTDGCFEPPSQYKADTRPESDAETASTRCSRSPREEASDGVTEPSDWPATDTDGEDSLGQAMLLTQKPPGTWTSRPAADSTCAAAVGAWTTLMVKQLPPQHSQQTVLGFLSALGVLRKLNFLYAPSNFRKRMLFGYCFLDFADHGSACEAMCLLRAVQWPGAHSHEVHVAWSEACQGREAQIERYRNCPVMHESVPEGYKPMLFSRGRRVSFPAPSEIILPPRNMKKTQMR